MRRRAVSPIKAAVAAVAILIILGAGVFAVLLTVPGFNNEMTQYTGINFAKEFGSITTGIRNIINNVNVSKPAGITVLTNNTALVKSIYFGASVPSSVPYYYIEANKTYVFNVTIVPANADGQPLPNDHMNVTLGLGNDIGKVNGKFNLIISTWAVWGNKTNGVASETTLYGITPIHAQLIIKIPYLNSEDSVAISLGYISVNNTPLSVTNYTPVWVLFATNSSS